MLMVFKFCGVATHGACPMAACFDMATTRGRFKMVHIWDLKVYGAQGGLIIYHGVMLKVELESDERSHSTGGGAMA